MLKLQVNIKLEQDDLPGTKLLLEQCIADDPETIISSACLLYKVCFFYIFIYLNKSFF